MKKRGRVKRCDYFLEQSLIRTMGSCGRINRSHREQLPKSTAALLIAVEVKRDSLRW